MKFRLWIAYMENVFCLHIVSSMAYQFSNQLLPNRQKHYSHSPEFPPCGALPALGLRPAACHYRTCYIHTLTPSQPESLPSE